MELDDLHGGTGLPAAEPEIIKEQTQSTEENREQEAQTEPQSETNTEEGDDELSPLEQWLATDYGIEGGMIPFEDGSKIHFTDLDEIDQVEVLKKLNESDRKEVAEDLSLNPDELSFISAIRQNKLSVQDAIEHMIQARLQAELLTRESTSVDFEKMSDDAIFISDLSLIDPTLTEDELIAELDKAKTLKNFTSSVKAMREGFIAKQQAIKVESENTLKLQQDKALEADRKRIVETAQDMSDISGIVLTDDIKNFLLEQVVEVNANNDPKFTEEIFSDPDKLLKAVFWYHYGEDSHKANQDYWKKEVQASYLRGRKEALGSETSRTSFLGRETKAPIQKKVVPETFNDLDSLHVK